MTMNNENVGSDNFAGEIPQRAVSIYGQNDGVDDFPVLKAFQQYIDAEQEKARKRILALGAFFGIVLVAIIIIFMVLLHSINSRNQLLNDRLVDYAMKESERRQVTPSATPSQDNEAMKAMTATLLSIQKQMSDQVCPPEKSDLATQALSDKLQKEKALLDAEKQRLAVEKERLRQIEIDRQRRKLYPELYERDYEDADWSATRTHHRSRQRTLSDDDIREIIQEAYPEEPEGKKRTEKADKENKDTSAEADKEEAEDTAIQYFKDDDYLIPIDVGGKPTKVKFTVPVDS